MIFLVVIGNLVLMWMLTMLIGWLVVSWGEWTLYPPNWRLFITPDVYMRWVDSRHPIGDNEA